MNFSKHPPSYRLVRKGKGIQTKVHICPVPFIPNSLHLLPPPLGSIAKSQLQLVFSLFPEFLDSICNVNMVC